MKIKEGMKILYCVAGMWNCGVLENDILDRDGFIISTKRAFTLEPSQAQVIGSQGQVINFVVVTYNNATMNCNFISDLPEQSRFHKEIAKVVEKEASSEN